MKTAHIVGIVVVLAICACSDDFERVDKAAEIRGTWSHTRDYTADQVLQHEFTCSSDGTFESYEKVYDRLSNNFVGYLNKWEGELKVEDGKLSFLIQVQSDAPGSIPQVDIAQLITRTASGTPYSNQKQYMIKLNDKKTVLKMQYICGPNEDCIANIPFEEYEKIDP